MAERLLTASDVAGLLQVPKSWVYAEARAGRIPHIRVGRYRRFHPESIDDWVRGREVGPRPRPPGDRPGGSGA
jgi:excisionase family DNA binding protein